MNIASYTRHIASLLMKFMVINELACCDTIFVRSKYIYSIGHIYKLRGGGYSRAAGGGGEMERFEEGGEEVYRM